MHPLIGIPCHSNHPRPRHLSRFCVLQTYCRALQATGAAPVLAPLLSDDEAVIDVCRRLDGLLLAGGGDIAPRHYGQVRSARLVSVDLPQDRVQLLLTRYAVNSNQPILGICRGLQGTQRRPGWYTVSGHLHTHPACPATRFPSRTPTRVLGARCHSTVWNPLVEHRGTRTPARQ